jgi:hypothetical protein
MRTVETLRDPSEMQSRRRDRILLRELNRELEKKGNPEWWQPILYRTHPEREVRIPLVRSSANQALAQEFFASVAQDKELLVRRAWILFQWARETA